MAALRQKGSVVRLFLGIPDCSVGINHTLAIERREGGRRRPPMPVRPIDKCQRWVESIGFESASYGTHSTRRTKAAQIYRKTGNIRAVQLLLGHTKLESTVRYLGIEVDDALNIAEQIEL